MIKLRQRDPDNNYSQILHMILAIVIPNNEEAHQDENKDES